MKDSGKGRAIESERGERKREKKEERKDESTGVCTGVWMAAYFTFLDF